MVGSLRQNTQKFASKYILGAVQSETGVLYNHQVRDLGMKSQREREKEIERLVRGVMAVFTSY